jgi:CRISPR-associated protein (TIGR03984 family)
MMKRATVECCYAVEPVRDVDPAFADDPKATWLIRHARAHGLTTLLAHADDGVIWGRVASGQLVLSGQAFPDVSPLLRASTLQQVRLFGEQAELLVWRDGDGEWLARLLRDEKDVSDDQWCLDECQLLWGDHEAGESVDGFTLVADGQQGLRHAVPLPARDILFGPPGWHPLRLKVRHYLARDEDGMLVIVQGRLVELQVEEWKEDLNG